MIARNLHVISVPQIKFLTTETVDSIFPALKVYFRHKNLTVLKPIMPMKLSKLLFKTDILRLLSVKGKWERISQLLGNKDQ